VSPRVRDAAIGASVVGVGIAGLASGLLGHPAAMNLAAMVLFVLVPPFVRALEGQITAQGMNERTADTPVSTNTLVHRSRCRRGRGICHQRESVLRTRARKSRY